MPHLEQYGVSVNIVFSLDQLRSRTQRVEQLIDCLLAPDPVPEVHRLLASLLRTLREVRSLRALMAGQYSLLARQVAERNAETGEHYITRDRAEYHDMLRTRRRRRRRHRRHHLHQVRGRSARDDGLLDRLLVGRQLRAELRAGDAAALDGGHQAAGHDGTGAGRVTARGAGNDDATIEGLRRPGGAAHPIAGGRHRRQPGPVRAAGAGLADGWPPGGFGAPLVGEKDAQYVLHSADAAGPHGPVSRPSPACCCLPAR
jgi:hypothetical protein